MYIKKYSRLEVHFKHNFRINQNSENSRKEKKTLVFVKTYSQNCSTVSEL